MKEFTTIDWIVFIAYASIIVFVGLWVSRRKKGVERTSQDYFLASRSLPWWAIGSTLLAANISAEHFIAMSGSGYAIGLAIAAYEWIAASFTDLCSQIFSSGIHQQRIFTMPDYLSQRYDRKVSTCFAVFWILVYIFRQYDFCYLSRSAGNGKDNRYSTGLRSYRICCIFSHILPLGRNKSCCMDRCYKCSCT